MHHNWKKPLNSPNRLFKVLNHLQMYLMSRESIVHCCLLIRYVTFYKAMMWLCDDVNLHSLSLGYCQALPALYLDIKLFNNPIFCIILSNRLQRECICLCHSSSRRGTCSGQCMLHGQTEGVQLWRKAAWGRGGLSHQTAPLATWGHPQGEGYGTWRHGALPCRPPRTPRLLGVGWLQPGCGIRWEVLEGLLGCPRNLPGHPCAYEAP